jgi:hypothetical protein
MTSSNISSKKKSYRVSHTRPSDILQKNVFRLKKSKELSDRYNICPFAFRNKEIQFIKSIL